MVLLRTKNEIYRALRARNLWLAEFWAFGYALFWLAAFAVFAALILMASIYVNAKILIDPELDGNKERLWGGVGSMLLCAILMIVGGICLRRYAIKKAGLCS